MKQVIEFFTTNSEAQVDEYFRYVGIHILETDPDMFFRLVDSIEELAVMNAVKEIYSKAVKSGDEHSPKVAMIKMYRDMTGEGLKESKEWVEENFDFSQWSNWS